ncbi:BTB/POZ domain-containing protein 3 [Mactra antiquata]
MSKRIPNSKNIDRGKTATIQKGRKYEVGDDKAGDTNKKTPNSDKNNLGMTNNDKNKSNTEDLFRKLKEDRIDKGKTLHPTDEIKDKPSKDSKKEAMSDSDDPPVIENLFLKMKEDREKAGIPLHPEKKREDSTLPYSSVNAKARKVKSEKMYRESTPSLGSRQNSDTFSRSVNLSISTPINTSRSCSPGINARKNPSDHSPGMSAIKNPTVHSSDIREEFDSSIHTMPKPGHRPAMTPIESTSPSTPSSLCISPWRESFVDIDGEDGNENDAPDRRESKKNGSRGCSLSPLSPNLLPDGDNNSNEVEAASERWQDDKTLAECNIYMFRNNIQSDVTIIVGTSDREVIKAHSFILSSRSPEFAKLLQSEEYIGSQVLVLTDIRLDVFKCIIGYIYTDDAEFNTEQALAIIPATGVLGPRALREKCLRYLLGEMSSEIACILLEYCYIYKHPYVYDKCLSFILVNALDVFNEDRFSDLSPQCVDDVTKSDDLNSDEYSVFEALVEWAEKECGRRQLYPTNENKREVLDMLIYNVRFATLEVDEFNTRISQRNVLKPEETMEIFQILHGKAGDIPDHINFQTRRQYNVKYHLQKELNGDNKPPGTMSRDAKSPIDEDQASKTSAKRTNQIVPDVDLPIRRVVRFQKFGDTWEMDGVDSIAFRVSVPIVLRGVQIFGPENDTECYIVDVKLYDDRENEVRSDRVMIEPTPDTIIYDVILQEPARIPADRFFTIQLIIHSGPTVEGAEGVKVLNSSGVIFEFKCVENSSPNTNVSNGQIPSILYSKINQ